MLKLRKEKMEKIKNVLLQLSSNGNRMTGEIERERLKSETRGQSNLTKSASRGAHSPVRLQ